MNFKFECPQSSRRTSATTDGSAPRGHTALRPLRVGALERHGHPAFAFLATDTASPYLDNRPLKTPGQPEWRDYRACWWDNDTATLAFGPVLRVIMGG